MQTNGAVAVRMQPRLSFSYPSAPEADDQVMIIDEHAPVVACPPPRPIDQLHFNQLADRPDHALALHAGLLGYIIVAVPTVTQL